MLVAHWTFEVAQVDGRTVGDVIGGGPPAVLDGHAEVVPGPAGGALRLDGTGRAVVAAAPRLVLSQLFGFAVAFSVDLTAGPGGEWRGLFYKQVAEHDARGIGIWLYPDEPRLRVQLFTSRGPAFVDSHRRLTPGEWAHVALVVDTGGMFLYLDGELDVAVPLEHPVVTPAGPIHLGAEPGRPGLTGLLADVRVYASALDEEAVRVLAEPG
ncbi:LamG domain-containing protein [Actinomadura macrotermitis]|uniref:LamG-like jellyroll fold domain-containing protein n=1 Tax=Actinomadura macrotermitis TaxID=2585200 RepID=A0A7K0BUG0_9ACTN|nr:LamG domain-containing protein [Actinomadura macrotermitis]MQY04840.1 hypothetical protein [Actinomadura macrotermitis]